MRRAAILLFVLVTFVPSAAFPQEYSYTHYDITEGLAGTTAYCITQDADGFIWVGTETGVSRFDGTHFRNFTTVDGLPDIEVVQIFGDSRGRVWMAPFKKSICYYYRGKIYNPGNDTTLSRISLKGNIEGFAEDARGDVLIQEREGLHVVLAGGGVRNIDSIGASPIRECTAVCRSPDGHFLIQERQNIWNFSDSFVFIKSIYIDGYGPLYIALNAKGVVWRSGYEQSEFESFVSGKVLYRRFRMDHYVSISYSMPDDGYVYFNEITGSTQLDPVSGTQRLFLPGIQVSRAFRDKDGSLWFTTLDHGIYRLNSEEFRTKVFGSSFQQQQAVQTIFRQKDSVWVGTDHDQIFQLAMPELKVLNKVEFLLEAKERVIFIDTFRRGMVFCSGYGVGLFDDHRKFLSDCVVPAKWARRLSADELLIGNALGVVIFNISLGWCTDTLWRGRSTIGLSYGGTIYFGTMNGLYKVNPDRSTVFLGKKIPFLTKRISTMAMAADSTLWVASYDDAGIIGVRNDKVVAVITKKEGLTSNICRTLLVQGQELWVGTDKGLSAIRLDKPGYPITRFTSNDGLGSDMINTLYSDDSIIYVGTSTGLSVFNESKVQTGEPCRLELLGLVNSGIDRIADTSDLSLSYRTKDIRFEYVGISYRSVGNIRYRYRMLGLDSTWRETGETHLDYPSLPSGGYVFQLEATNKFGVHSELLSMPFRVQTPYWEAVWFKVSLLTILVALTWMLVGWRIRYIRSKQQEKENLIRKGAKMENQALLAQMNPHFIFNCLNSIQQFVFDQDMVQTNEYITGFSRLIRATLHNSSQSLITVEKEVEYLSDYLALEKMRFKEKMEYFIEVDPEIDTENTLLPPMLIQPFVENAMRHGLRNKPGGNGFIRINMRKSADGLVIVIEDNGIGRKKAMEYKTGEHIEYQSRGMALTADRIKVVRALYGVHIGMKVEDRLAKSGAEGTKVMIVIPGFPQVV
jgi:ligand-binding sensor domain-containing protein